MGRKKDISLVSQEATVVIPGRKERRGNWEGPETESGPQKDYLGGRPDDVQKGKV